MSAESKGRTGSYATRPGNATEPSVEPSASGDGRVRATPRADGRSVPDLLRELSSEGADLVRQEVALAKAEMQEKMVVFQRNLVSIAVGGALMLASLLTGLFFVNRGLTALLAQVMGVETAVWLSPLILTVVLAAAGWGMIQKGKNALGDEGLTPQKTKATLTEDKRWAQAKAREVKEDFKHG